MHALKTCRTHSLDMHLQQPFLGDAKMADAEPMPEGEDANAAAVKLQAIKRGK